MLSTTNHNSGPRILGSEVLNAASQAHADIDFSAAGKQLDGGSVAAIAPSANTEGRKSTQARALRVPRVGGTCGPSQPVMVN
jgi:hypothetical protein